VPLALDLASQPRNRQQWRMAMAALASDERVRGVCAVEGERLAATAALEVRALVQAGVSRIGHIRTHLMSARRPLRQVSLFDRRAEREAEAGQQVRERLDAHLEQRARHLLDLLSKIPQFTIRLIAAWAGGD